MNLEGRKRKRDPRNSKTFTGEVYGDGAKGGLDGIGPGGGVPDFAFGRTRVNNPKIPKILSLERDNLKIRALILSFS